MSTRYQDTVGMLVSLRPCMDEMVMMSTQLSVYLSADETLGYGEEAVEMNIAE